MAWITMMVKIDAQEWDHRYSDRQKSLLRRDVIINEVICHGSSLLVAE